MALNNGFLDNMDDYRDALQAYLAYAAHHDDRGTIFSSPADFSDIIPVGAYVDGDDDSTQYHRIDLPNDTYAVLFTDGGYILGVVTR